MVAPGGNEFAVEVYDASGKDGAPGEKLAGPFKANALRNGEWTKVDLEDQAITVDGDFYLVYIQTKKNTESPGTLQQMKMDQMLKEAGS
nr:hypothetical protein P5627_15990 [Bacillus safensis]